MESTKYTVIQKDTVSRLWPPIPFPSSNPLHSLVARSSNVTLCSAPRSIVAITLAAEEALAVINLRGKGEDGKGPPRERESGERKKPLYGDTGLIEKKDDIHSRIKKHENENPRTNLSEEFSL